VPHMGQVCSSDAFKLSLRFSLPNNSQPTTRTTRCSSFLYSISFVGLGLRRQNITRSAIGHQEVADQGGRATADSEAHGRRLDGPSGSIPSRAGRQAELQQLIAAAAACTLHMYAKSNRNAFRFGGIPHDEIYWESLQLCARSTRSNHWTEFVFN